MKIYTLTGDGGTTALVGGSRVSKDDVRVEAYGTVDELNANMGLLAHNSKLEKAEHRFLLKIQNKLFNLGAYLANPKADAELKGISAADVKEIEDRIDAMTAELPPAAGFLLPGGSRLSALCDVCRTVARRAERRVVTLSKAAQVDALALKYLNRLSDFFFTFARYHNVTSQTEEILWDPKA